jgi:hypothetical protein
VGECDFDDVTVKRIGDIDTRIEQEEDGTCVVYLQVVT